MLETAIINKAFDRATSNPTREEYNVDGTLRLQPPTATNTANPTLYHAVRRRALERRATTPDHYNWRDRRIHYNITLTEEEIDYRRRQTQARIEDEARANTRRRQPANHYNGITNFPSRGLLTPTISTPQSPTPTSPATPQYIDTLTGQPGTGDHTPPPIAPQSPVPPWQREALNYLAANGHQVPRRD